MFVVVASSEKSPMFSIMLTFGASRATKEGPTDSGREKKEKAYSVSHGLCLQNFSHFTYLDRCCCCAFFRLFQSVFTSLQSKFYSYQQHGWRGPRRRKRRQQEAREEECGSFLLGFWFGNLNEIDNNITREFGLIVCTYVANPILSPSAWCCRSLGKTLQLFKLVPAVERYSRINVTEYVWHRPNKVHLVDPPPNP